MTLTTKFPEDFIHRRLWKLDVVIALFVGLLAGAIGTALVIIEKYDLVINKVGGLAG